MENCHTINSIVGSGVEVTGKSSVILHSHLEVKPLSHCHHQTNPRGHVIRCTWYIHGWFKDITLYNGTMPLFLWIMLYTKVHFHHMSCVHICSSIVKWTLIDLQVSGLVYLSLCTFLGVTSRDLPLFTHKTSAIWKEIISQQARWTHVIGDSSKCVDCDFL